MILTRKAIEKIADIIAIDVKNYQPIRTWLDTDAELRAELERYKKALEKLATKFVDSSDDFIAIMCNEINPKLCSETCTECLTKWALGDLDKGGGE